MTGMPDLSKASALVVQGPDRFKPWIEGGHKGCTLTLSPAEQQGLWSLTEEDEYNVEYMRAMG